jgi:Tfp pilus assembly protein PilN
MIDINLIPSALRKNGKGDADSLKINIPQEVLVGVGAGAIFLIVTIHLLLGVVWLVDMGRLSSSKAGWDKLSSDKTVLDSIHKEAGDLKDKIKVISGMTTKKSALWSPKLNAISDSLPGGVWIRRMTLDKVGLTIEGSVVSKSRNEINNVGLFLSALKKNNYFMKDFSSLEVNSIQGSRSNAVDIIDFSVMAKLKFPDDSGAKPAAK